MTFSEKAVGFLMELEAIRYKAYKDSAGKWTIGVGHLIKKGEEYLLKKTLTKEEVEELLKKDIPEFEQAVNALVHVPVTQVQFDALVIFAFNIGTPRFATSTVLRMLNKRDYAGACSHFDDWNKIRDTHGALVFCKGLQNRRDEEQELFTGGDYEKQR